MAAEIDRGSNRDGRLALAYSLVDERGRLIDSQIDREVKTPVSPEGVQKYTGFILSECHRHAHAEDCRRRRAGSSGERRAFVPGGVDPGRPDSCGRSPARRRPQDVCAARQPVVGGEFTSGMVNGYIELYADETDLLKNTTVMFEVAADAQSRALDGAAGRVQPATADAPNRRALEGSIPIALLPPGDYVARAVVSTDGRKVGQVTRPFRVGRTVTVTRPKPAVGPRLTTTRSADDSGHVGHRTFRPGVSSHAAGRWLFHGTPECRGSRRIQPGPHRRARACGPLRRGAQVARAPARHRCRHHS